MLCKICMFEACATQRVATELSRRLGSPFVYPFGSDFFSVPAVFFAMENHSNDRSFSGSNLQVCGTPRCTIKSSLTWNPGQRTALLAHILFIFISFREKNRALSIFQPLKKRAHILSFLTSPKICHGKMIFPSSRCFAFNGS